MGLCGGRRNAIECLIGRIIYTNLIALSLYHQQIRNPHYGNSRLSIVNASFVKTHL